MVVSNDILSLLSVGPRSYRRVILSLIDGTLAGVSLWLAVYLRVGSTISDALRGSVLIATPVFVVVVLAVFHALGVYSRLWRYTSISDFIVTIRAGTIAIGLFLPLVYFTSVFGPIPRSVPFIQWFVLIILFGGARVIRRLLREAQLARVPGKAPSDGGGHRRPTLLVATGEGADVVLRSVWHNPDSTFEPVGILDPKGTHLGLRIRGVPVLGTTDALEQVVEELAAKGARPESLLISEPKDGLGGAMLLKLATRGGSLGLKVARLPVAGQERENEFDLRSIDMTMLLGRTPAELSIDVVRRVVSGRRILVTGAGGTIGRELTRQIAALNPAKLILVDAGEFNLYSVDQELQENHPSIERVPLLCCVRERDQVMQVFAEHRPELVFHAAALKHVPLVELNAGAGAMTNVLGTRNVADAARRHGALAMVQVSTDKAVNPVGVMGATKRLAELYCQALDLDGADAPGATRCMTVRFGNVLGSSGSLIPLFQRQLSRGMPLTVTHPEIRRYFMTVHEAVQLTLHTSARALENAPRRGRIFVLDMGEPLKIIEIARRVIRLAGLRPDVDVKIDIIGLRPGEKLYEELFDAAEKRLPSEIPGIFEAEPTPVALQRLNRVCDDLARASALGDDEEVVRLLAAVLPGYQPDRETRPEKQDGALVAQPAAQIVPALAN